MTVVKKLQIYKCEICGNIVEVIHAGKPALVCCEKPMTLCTENSTYASQEKHVPILKETSNGIIVKIGSRPHPMEDTHYIEWIQINTKNKSYREFLNPGDTPEAKFEINADENINIEIRAYCNLHGLWRN